MFFLKLFKSDPMNLIGPNLASAPTKRLDLSGSVLSFLNPPTTAAVHSVLADRAFDIYNDPETEINQPFMSSVLIYSGGWDFEDRYFGGIDYGGLVLKIPLVYLPGISGPADSLLVRRNFEQYIFHSSETFYGTWNKEKEKNRGQYYSESEFQESLWKYPKCPEDLQWVNLHGRDWARYEIYTDGYRKEIMYETPFTHQHVISLAWSPEAYHGIDFYSANHNLRAATYTLMDGIMATMKIDLSKEARKHYAEVGLPVPEPIENPVP